MTRPNLRVLNTDTGELEQDAYGYQLEELNRKYLGLLGENGRLRKQIAELRMVEPEAQAIRDILEYTRDRIGKPGQHIIEGGERWEKVRARLKDRIDGRGPLTPDELKLAADGALLDPWLNGTAYKAPKDGRYLDAKTIFKSGDQVLKLRDLAIGFKGTAGVHLRDLLDVADELHIISWKHSLRICECGHRRIEHARCDPQKEGRELCFMCDCRDFYEDVLEQLGVV